MTFDLNVDGATDDLRIFAAGVAEPASVALFGLAFAGLVATRRRNS
ncbi:MAG: PEP-CTERM sorting domain-containing protein [Massilia sp.]|nr:PEP-CTERM sorting domain-containing protein [Massilia sp.]